MTLATIGRIVHYKLNEQDAAQINNDTFWATSVGEGDGERQWSWPPRV